MVGDETIKIDGRSHVKETVGGVSYLVSPTAFFQTNVGAAENLVKLVLGVKPSVDRAASSISIAAAGCSRCRSRRRARW